jgi:very-short-patch-repair endonuclease
MWKYLQSFRPYGARFRRQTPIGSYIADFAWLSARIVVEVDGISHDATEQRERDRRKDAFLQREGFQVFRVSDNKVIANLPQVFAEIETAIRGCLGAPPQPLPTRGRGLVANDDGPR